jgi:hypothetical protein
VHSVVCRTPATCLVAIRIYLQIYTIYHHIYHRFPNKFHEQVVPSRNTCSLEKLYGQIARHNCELLQSCKDLGIFHLNRQNNHHCNFHKSPHKYSRLHENCYRLAPGLSFELRAIHKSCSLHLQQKMKHQPNHHSWNQQKVSANWMGTMEWTEIRL